MQKVIAKEGLEKFVSGLMKEYEVIAPVVRNKVSKFEVIKNAKEIYLERNTFVPLKQFFMPEGEELFEYREGKIRAPKENKKKRVIFGIRKCDLNALLVLDKVMLDPFYVAKRKSTLLIGMFCSKPDEYCFCNSMELVDYYDVFLYPKEKNYYISAGSKAGEKIVKNLKKADKEVIKKEKNFKSLMNKEIVSEYKNKKWNKDIDICLSCTACTIYCPTCNCFDIRDELDLNLKGGKRIRKATSCQLQGFTQVAGGKSFRESRDSRFKHFVYHKIVFYKSRFNKYMCTGCGRCLRACPTKIDWVETINKIKKVKK